MKSENVLSKLRIEGMAGEGRGLARLDGKVVFVDHAVPGDVVDIVTTKNKKDFAIGRITHLVEPSAFRVEPFCSHFGACGGCRWQHIAYAKQTDFKQQLVVEALQRIAKIAEPEVQSIIGSENDRAYRNKLEFTFTDSRWLTNEEIGSAETFDRRGLGFHVPGAFDRVINLETCWLQDDYSNTIRETANQVAIRHDLSFFNLRSPSGFLRNLIVRNTTTDEWMVVVVFGEDDEAKRNTYLKELSLQLERVTSWHYIVNRKLNDSIADQEAVHFSGSPTITEQLADVKFQIGPKSFFQTNSKQALRLYNVVKEWGALNGTQHVLDLYCGTGSIGLFLAADCKSVTGIESISEAVEDATQNALLNGISNATFHCADIEKSNWSSMIDNKPELIVLDPPRAGLHPKVVETLLEVESDRIIYVSCNPATQARDIFLLGEKYEFVRCRPVDMFPQTHHVENVALLKRL